MKISVLAANGLGGTDKAAFLFAGELARRGHKVELLTDPLGPRTATLEGTGVKILDVPYSPVDIGRYLEASKPEIIHQHVSGYGDHRALYDPLRALGPGRPKLVETNVFGQMLDRYDRGLVDFRMFISMASGTQAFLRPQTTRCAMSADKHSVLYYPLAEGQSMDPSVRAALRRDLGVGADDLLIIRTGRPSIKWTDWECQAFKAARKKNPHLRLFLMEPPERLGDKINRGEYGGGILIRKTTADFHHLEQLYLASDLMLHASSWGESFGYTLAEGLQAGLPVITRTTPWVDNAQVELVQHGRNGMVCCSVRGMTAALLALAADAPLRLKMSQAAGQSIRKITHLSGETDLLEEIMDWVVHRRRGEQMDLRFEQWKHYAEREFARAEWRVYEKDSHLFGALFFGYLYAVFRTIKFSWGSRLRSLLSK